MTTATKPVPTCPACALPLVRDDDNRVFLVCPTYVTALDAWLYDERRLEPGAVVPFEPACRYREIRHDFTIPACNIAALAARIGKLQARAEKLGLAPLTLTIGAPEDREVEPARGDKPAVFAAFHAVTLTGDAPQIDGWTFAAALDHDGESNVIRSVLRDEEIPAKYRSAAPQCDHCHAQRRRVYTYVLRHETGAWIQVGKQCLRDFLGHGSPEALAAWAEFIIDATDACRGLEDFEGGGGSGRFMGYDIEAYMVRVAQSVRLNGWVSRKMADERMLCSTCNDALNLHAPGRNASTTPKPETIDRERAAGALAWARALGGDDGAMAEELPEYLWNVRAASRRGAVDGKTMGIVASILVAWDRDLAKRAPKRPSEWIGAIKAPGQKKYKRPVLRLMVERVVVLESLEWGTSFLHLLVDADGNRATWKTGTTKLDEGAWYDVTATIEAHEVYVPRGAPKGTEGTK